MKPTLAICNFLSDPDDLKALALDNGFGGVDWSFDLDALPETPPEISRWAQRISALDPLEVRYHCPFYQLDLGHDDPGEAQKAATVFQRIIRLVSKARGRFLTIHIGLGYDSTEPLSWKTTMANLRNLVHFAQQRTVTVCLENLAWGWTSKPQLFEKLIRGSGAAVTFDIGHAQCCEPVRSQYYSIEDFVTPHPERVQNAHVYHEEVSGLGHVPPGDLQDIKGRLDLLQAVGCLWWTLEVRNEQGVLQTKNIVDQYLTQIHESGKS
ncbi:MAG: TIM barrel protein, partial [Deltaproteobacteria bacterium]|nr:TIM barrel protein [Deltaproteobacteria bacterium]